MTTRRAAAGFTLVELAVVLIIVGLVAGGVLGAGRLRQNAAINATIAQAMSYGAASAVFVDRFGALPGDLREANKRLPGCSGSCAADPDAPTTGDGKVGIPGGISLAQTSAASPADETMLFWLHLRLTDLVSGTTDAFAVAGASAAAWGATHPAAPVGGGFHVKTADGAVTQPLPGWPPLARKPMGTYVVLQPGVARNLVPAVAGGQVLAAIDAASIDRKIDDGDPFRGLVVAYGAVGVGITRNACVVWTAVDRGGYADSATKSCGLAFRIAP